MTSSPSIVWFRNDLRLGDNPALHAAVERGQPIIPVFIHAAKEEGSWRPGEASEWWLHRSLERLAAELREHGSRLIIRSGRSLPELTTIVAETNAGAVFWNRRYEPASIARDKTVKSALRHEKLTVESFNGQLLFEPWEVATKEGNPYQVFTAFWRACMAKPAPAEPIPAPRKLPVPQSWPPSLPLEELHLLPSRSWIDGLDQAWEPGANGAKSHLKKFLAHTIIDYDSARDRPAESGTSRLSPHLHFGEITPRQVWHAVQVARAKASQAGKPGFETFLKEIGWREFAHHLLFHFPTTTDQPLRAEFAKFPWENNRRALRAWQRGCTGYPIVDAGMRELWATGWMHNRVRMIAASFLVKDLRLHWRLGAEWFWDTLVDADLANNTLGWQWSAGCGADAAPYFRVFNPVLQSSKFDPEGHYLRRWVPELKSLPTKWLHAPWTAPDEELQSAGIKLGDTYPSPIVDHNEARTLALQAFEHIKRARTQD